MKTSKNYFKNLAKTAVFTAALSIVLAACSKDNNNTPQIPPARVAQFHASVNAPELILTSNGSKSPVTGFSYGKGSGYIDLGTGTSEFKITKTDNTDLIAKTTVKLSSSKYYSLFVVDSLQTSVLKVIEDDLTAPAADKAKIRFINLSADAGSVDVNVKGQPTLLFSKQDFKQAAAFAAIDPNDAYTFEVKANGTATVLATSTAFKVEKGKVYTVYIRGLKSATAAPNILTVGVITNK